MTDRDDTPRKPQQDPYEAAREIALRQLTAADRSCHELHTRLVARGVEESVARAVVDRFVEVGLLDDAQFARHWVSSRQQGRGLSRRVIERELADKGIEPELVEQALAGVDAQTERDTALRLVERKARGMRGLDEQVRMRRLVGMLARKGYAPDVAYEVVRQALEEQTEDHPA